MSLLLGYDVGSSSIKAALVDAQSGKILASAASPAAEMPIDATQAGWAEQDPDMWWRYVIETTAKIRQSCDFDPSDVKAIGISYQMHGLVAVDKNLKMLRPAIIWCDSRAVETGEKAAKEIGPDKCLENFLNLPGNFTASKLKWVMDNQPEIYSQIHKVMLPGDYIAMKMTDRICTTVSGLSEGILWDFKNNCVAQAVLDNYGIDPQLLPDIAPTFGVQGQLTSFAADQLGLVKDIPISYRAGDQPNNAFSLNVLEPGQVAVTAGTSGVVYGITDKANYDKLSRVNTFVHVNHTEHANRYGVLLCLNGTGILNSWLKHNLASHGDKGLSYEQMNELAATVQPGCEGLFIFPYGNGAERTLANRNISAAVSGWNFNIHKKQHFLRAGQEGIVFALNYGLEIMRQMGMQFDTARAGYANMFLSPVFTSIFASLTKSSVQLYNTDGSQGAARAAGVGCGIFSDYQQAFEGVKPVKVIDPDDKLSSVYEQIYLNWKDILTNKLLNN